MGAYDISSESEAALIDQFSRNQTLQDLARNAATPEMAFVIDDLVRAAPNATADLVMPAAQAVLSGAMTADEAQQVLLGGVQAAIETAPPPVEEEKSWWDRGVDTMMSKVRTGTRWGFAALEFIPQSVQNIAARAYGSEANPFRSDEFTGSETGFFDGFIVSTDFGQMLRGTEAGTGFFIGEAAAEQQRQKALEYRGTIGDEGWTLGRGFAVSFSQPGSRPYNILSGVVDAAAALATPSVPGIRLVGKAGAAGADLLKLRSTAGLTNFAESAIDVGKARNWLETRSGRSAIERLYKVADHEEAMELFPNADANFWEDVVNTKNFDDAKALLTRDLGLQPGLQSVDDLNIGRSGAAGRALLKRSKGFSRLKAPVPGREMIIATDDIRDVTRTLRNARDYLRTAGVSYDERVEVLRQMSEALTPLGAAPKAREALNAMDNAIITALSRKRKSPFARSMDEDFARTVFQKYRDEIRDLDVHGRIDNQGDAITIADIRVSVDGQLEKITGELVEPTAMLTTEAKRWGYFMPDPRRVRRVSSQYSWMFSKNPSGEYQWGDPRMLTSFLDFVQNRVWRPATLLTGGYIFRNMIESVFRQTMTPGIKTGPTHPLEWAQTMFHRKFKGDVNGDEWVNSASDMMRRHQREYADATGNVMREALDPMRMQEAALGRGYYALARKRTFDPARSSNQYVRGLANELRLLAGDDLVRIVASRQLDDADIIEWLTTTPDGIKRLRTAEALWTDKRFIDSATGEEFIGSMKIIDDTDPNNLVFDEENIKALLREVRKTIEIKTGGLEELKDVVGNSGPIADIRFANLGEFGEHITRDGRQLNAWNKVELSGENWRNFDYNEEFLAEIRQLLADPATAARLPDTVKFIDSPTNITGAGGKTVDSWWRRTTDHFFGSVYGKKEAFLNRSPVFRKYYYRRIEQLMGNMSREGAETMIENIQRAYRAIPEENLRNMRRLKPNKAGKYEWNGKELSKSEYNKRVKQLENQLKRRDPEDFDKWAANYVGSKKLWNQITDAKVNGRVGKGDDILTGERADILAKAFALEETKKVFYNASDKSNFADILRIVVPFGPAWGEAMRMWRKQVLRNPNRVKNLGVSIQGFRDMDPDGDGTGFVMKDPVSGEMVFNYPFSADMLPIIGGVAGGLLGETFFGARAGGPVAFLGGAIAGGGLGLGAREVVEERLGDAQIQLQAPVRSLSMALNVVPGLGPVVQLSAAQALQNRPEADDILGIISPFGPPESAWEFAPSWARKIVQGITANPESDRMYLDLFMDAYRAMYTTGEYDTNSSESMQLLRERAEDIARTLLVFRGLAQFTGPARPSVGFEVPVKYSGIELTDEELAAYAREGSVPDNILANTFRKMQEEDYQNAVYNFISTFGTDTLLYVKGRTETVGQGLDASQIFGDWERRNTDLAEAFPTVFGYFAPVGSEFDLQTYLRQIATGKRRRITDPTELQADAEAVVGKALYRRAVRDFPRNPNEVDEAALREYRRQLEEELPGFKYQVIELGQREIYMAQLFQAAREAPDLQDNPIAEAVRVYEQYRSNAMREAELRNNGEPGEGLLTRKANEDLRQYLRNIGETIINRTPEFERVWSRLLFDEVDVNE
jgi:hypothetical protein